MLYDKATFSHIICTGIHNAMYHCQDKRTFLRNCYHWLIPNGYLILQLVDRERFDPIPASGKSKVLVNPQKIATERITEAEINFNDFQYKSSYDFSKKEKVVLTETFTDSISRKVRQNEHVLYMEDVDQILYLARNCGFVVVGQTNLVEKGDEHQYIYLLERPT